MRIVHLSDHTGADVLDVDIRALSDTDFERIRQVWLERCVIRLRGQPLDVHELQRFSARFGPLEEMPQYARLSEEARQRIANKYVTVISNIKVDGKPIGGLGNAEANWHSDMTYNPVPPTASVLLGEEVPPSGGDTHFVNQVAAYEAMPDAMKQRLQQVHIKHDAAHTSVGDLRSTYAQPSSPMDAPGAVHPAVITHPETGRKALFLGRRDWAYIPGLPLDESEALLDEIWSYAAPPELVWTQQWQVGDLIVWDNRSTLHRRDGFDGSQRRLMRRCQVLARTSS